MRNSLSHAVLFHWTVVFSALALVCTMEPESGLAGPLRLLGLHAPEGSFASGLVASAVFGSGFLLAAALFGWALLTGVAGEDGAGETSRRAFAVAVTMLTALFGAGAFDAIGGLAGTVAALLAAAVATHLALNGDRNERAQSPVSPGQTAARIMAADAAHTSSMRGQPGAGPMQPEGRS